MRKIFRRTLALTVLSSLWLTSGLDAIATVAREHLAPPAPRAPSAAPAPAPAPAASASAAKGPDYHHDESTNPEGPGKCRKNEDCDGKRMCIQTVTHPPTYVTQRYTLRSGEVLQPGHIGTCEGQAR